MSPGFHSTAPTGLGKGRGLVLMMGSGFSASIFPQDNTEAAGTYPSLEYTVPVQPWQQFWAAAEGVCLWQQRGEKCRWFMAAHLAPGSCTTRPGARLGSTGAHVGLHPSNTSCTKPASTGAPEFWFCSCYWQLTRENRESA